MVVYSFARALAPEANRFALGFQREAHSGPHFDLPCWPPYQPGQIIFFQTGVPHIVLYTFYVQLASLGGTLGPLKSDLGQYWRFPAIYFYIKNLSKPLWKCQTTNFYLQLDCENSITFSEQLSSFPQICYCVSHRLTITSINVFMSKIIQFLAEW